MKNKKQYIYFTELGNKNSRNSIYITIDKHKREFVEIGCEIRLDPPLPSIHEKKLLQDNLKSSLRDTIDENKIWKLLNNNVLKHPRSAAAPEFFMPYEHITSYLIKANLWAAFFGILLLFFSTTELTIAAALVYQISLLLSLLAYSLRLKEKNLINKLYHSFLLLFC